MDEYRILAIAFLVIWFAVFLRMQFTYKGVVSNVAHSMVYAAGLTYIAIPLVVLIVLTVMGVELG